MTARAGGAWRASPVVLAWLLSASLLALLVLPIVALFGSTSANAIGSAFQRPDVRLSLGFTLLASAFALAATLLLGVPLGYLLARRRFPGQAVVESVLALPIVLPHLLAGLAIFLLFAPTSPVGRALEAAGFPPGWPVATIWGVVAVMIFVSAPYAVLASQLAFRAVDPRLLEAARSIGASPAQAFREVTLPLASRGIVAGALLAWARSVSEIGGFLIVAYAVYPSPGYPGPPTAPISIYIFDLYQIGDLPGATSVAALLVLLALALFLLVRLVERSGRLPWNPGALVP